MDKREYLNRLSDFQLSFLYESMDTLYSDGYFKDGAEEMDKEVQGLFIDIKAEMDSRGFTPEQLNEWIVEDNAKWEWR